MGVQLSPLKECVIHIRMLGTIRHPKNLKCIDAEALNEWEGEEGTQYTHL